MFIQFRVKNFYVAFFSLLRYFHLSDIEQRSGINAVFISKLIQKFDDVSLYEYLLISNVFANSRTY